VDIVVRGTRLHYVEGGDGFPVILLHGNGLTHAAWRHFFPQAAKHYRTIAYDLRAMGGSEAPGRRGVVFTNEDHARDLEAFLDALGIERAALVGHAFGAMVAMRTAIDHPERVRALVIVDTAAKMEGRTLASLPGWAETVERDGMLPLVEETMDRWFIPRVHRDHPDTIRFYADMVAANPPMGYAANCRGIPQYDIGSEIGSIRAPALVIGGSDDRSVSLPSKEALARGIPGARMVVVPDASHTVPEEQPETFNRVALSFLAEHIPQRVEGPGRGGRRTRRINVDGGGAADVIARSKTSTVEE
jgi:3-oxoadipate enol-lactonase